MKKYLPLLLLAVIIFAGFFLRLKGISTNHSFWSDEAYVADTARSIANGNSSIINGLLRPGISYQPLHTLIIALSFALLGLSEFAARLPSVIFGTVAILFVYLIAAKLSTKSGGLLAAFLYSFSQLELANATQAKPYTGISLALLIIIYVILQLNDRKHKSEIILHAVIIGSILFGYLLNILGSLLLIPYIVFVIFRYKKLIFEYSKKPLYMLVALIFVVAIFFVFQIPKNIYNLIYLSGNHNNITFLRELIWKEYGFIVLPAIIGFFLYWKNKTLFWGIALWSIALLLLWNFKEYSHNIRYLLPFFSLLFIFFGTFWSSVGEKLFNKRAAAVCLCVALLIFLGGNKVVRKPSVYYSPNADLYGDVQNANYKAAYAFLNKNFSSPSFAYFDDGIDNHLWYTNKKPNVYFTKFMKDGTIDPVTKIPKYSSLSAFLRETAKHKKGVIVVEDWESFLPEDIKQYVKKHFKLEYQIDSLSAAPGDKWPVGVYTWGK